VRGFRLPVDQPHNYRALVGAYEPETTRMFRRLVEPGMTVVDVGASLGYYTRLCAGLVGRTGHVHAFEPHPVSLALLRNNVRRCPNVTVHAAAAHSADTTLTLYGGRSGVHSLWRSSLDTVRDDAFEVQAVRLDSVLHGRPVDLVKIDAEAHEPEVIAGMSELIETQPGLAIILEYYPELLRRRGLDPAAFLHGLFGRGFGVVAIDDRNGGVRRIEPDGVAALERSIVRYANLVLARADWLARAGG
jgi:FkbM family methyltransferase